MPTGQQIIDRALRLLTVLSSGKAATPQESADALVALNDMISSWQLSRLSAYAHQTEVLTLVPSQGSYTIGPAGNLDTTRPAAIVVAYLRQNGEDTPVTIFSRELWAALPSKAELGTPECLNYENTMPQGILQCYPVPKTAGTLHLVTRVPLTAFSLTGDLTLPPGYARAIAYNLAVELAPEWEVPVPKAVALVAIESLAAIQRANQEPVNAHQELIGLTGRGV